MEKTRTASNPYTYAVVAPQSEGSPTATLTISPIWGTYTTITTSTIAAASTTSSSTTLTFLLSLHPSVYWRCLSQAYGGWIIGIIVAIGLVTLYSLRRSKDGRAEAQVTSEEGKTAQVSEASVDTQFCTQCGLELPVGSRFCFWCGSKQES